MVRTMSEDPRFSPGGWQLFARILHLVRLGPGSLTQMKVERGKDRHTNTSAYSRHRGSPEQPDEGAPAKKQPGVSGRFFYGQHREGEQASLGGISL